MTDLLSDSILRVEGIGKTFVTGFRRRKVPVLRDVTFEVARGEIFALLGPNGAGKTTLMKIILGLVRPTCGRGTFLGSPLGDLEARAHVGFQPEQPYLYPALTVKETLELMAALSRLPRRRAVVRIDAVIEQCSLGGHLETRVRKLSRGWLQRLTLAAALLSDPQLLLLDEPLGGLDPGARIAIKELIRSLRDEGKTIMLNSHILPDVETLADRIALLTEGRIIASGRLTELLEREDEGVEIEIQCASSVPMPADCTRIWERPESGHSLLRVPGDDHEALQRVLMDLLRAGAMIRSVAPRRLALEAFFAQAMAQTRECGDHKRTPGIVAEDPRAEDGARRAAS